jgi:PAS domain S-box-containing protein
MGSLTIAQRLWLGLALILGLFASADLISLWAARKVDLTLYDLVRTGEERRNAGYDMRDSLAAVLSAVQTYASTGLPQQRNAIGQAESVFLQALAHYQAVALTQRSQTFSQTTTTGFNAVKGEAQRVIALADQQAHALDTLSTHQRTVDALLRKMPAVVAPARQSPPMRKRLIARALEDELRLAARPLAERIKVAGGALKGQLSGERAAFASTLMSYRSLAETAAERAFANAAGTWYSTNLRAAQSIVQSAADTQRALVILSATAQALDIHLATALQPNARAELSAAVEKASGIAHHANTLISRGLLLALVLGALAAMITVRAVRAPLGRLVASSRRLAEGDLAHRVAWSSKDELGELTDAFDDMAAKLEASTVSRSYLESIVNNVAHPLFVVSERGIIQTANAAAERLLEYQQGELVGKPLVSVVDTDLVAAAAASEYGVAHTNATLMPTTGIAVPVAVSAVQMRTSPRAAPALVCVAQDLRERMRAEQHRRQTETAFENSTEGIILTDAKRDILVVNPAFVHITGHQAQDVKGMCVPTLWSDSEGSQCGAAVWDEVEAQGQWQGELSSATATGNCVRCG